MIKFVYFDLGGVVIKDFSGTNKWEEIKNDLGVINLGFDDWFDNLELCLGKNSLDQKFENIVVSLNDFIDRFESNPSISPIIDSIHKKCRIGLLTNAYPNMLNQIINRKMIPEFNWDVSIDSSVVGLQKPDPKIYELAEKLSGCNREEILFVENTKGHIEVAKSFGWRTFLYDSKNYEKSSLELLEYFNEAQKSQI
ncbi:MAG: HAD-IA family hydrolase [Candidatus Amesbacteria bacterium]|nr:HAD-IA family hydrolase [Candidatus Amesbacteria bacterium]